MMHGSRIPLLETTIMKFGSVWIMLLWATFGIGLSFHTTLELMGKRIIVGFQLVLDRPAPQLGADEIARPTDHMGCDRCCHHHKNDDRNSASDYGYLTEVQRNREHDQNDPQGRSLGGSVHAGQQVGHAQQAQ